MTISSIPEPIEERLAELLEERAAEGHLTRVETLLRRLGHYDRVAYRAVADTTMPVLDAPLRTIADAANFSRPWFVIAGLLAAFGGPSGRRAAVAGVVAIGVTSFVVNQPMKLAGGRRRPERAKHGVPVSRWVRMPTSTSFPSGHSASAATFAVAVGDLAPSLRAPLGAAASAVCFSRVYTGVHYPGDVVAGAFVGAALGRLTSAVVRRVATSG
jgi:undecaprenyl-diphosphatase